MRPAVVSLASVPRHAADVGIIGTLHTKGNPVNGIFASIRKFSLGAACVLALGATAHAQNQEFMINNNAAGDFTRFSYVDFATSTIGGHAGVTSGTFQGTPGIHYKLVTLNNGNLSSTTQCYEVFTSAPFLLPGTVSDTRIWIVSGIGSLASPFPLHDDNNYPTDRYSTARVYLKGAPGSQVDLAVAAFDPTNWNSIHFNLGVRQLPATEAACTTGQTKPWVKVINGTMTVSPNAG
jgi:hypothetical protein